MIGDTELHGRSHIDMLPAVIPLLQAQRRVRLAQIVISLEKIKTGLHGLPGAPEGHCPAPDPRIEQPDREILPLDRGRVEKAIRYVAEGDIPPDLLQFLPLAGLLHHAVVEVRERL